MNEFVIPNNSEDFKNILNELLDEGKRVVFKKFIDDNSSFSCKCEVNNTFVRVVNCYVNFVIRPYFISEKSYDTYKISLVTLSGHKENYYVGDFVSIINKIQDFGEFKIVKEEDVEEVVNTIEIKEKATMLDVFRGNHIGGYKIRTCDFRTMTEK